MAIIGIVAIDRNYAIGRAGAIPWHYSSDLKFFKAQTMGHACVMGYRTWESIGRPLPGRLNIVLSRTRKPETVQGVIHLDSAGEVLSLKEFLNCDLYIIGGAQVYAAFADVIDQWVVTRVPLAVDGADTFMPGSFLEGYKVMGSKELEEGLVVEFYERDPVG
jgi:dihydrofolate reductase